jgi:cytoskeletal protein RodZ
MNQFTLKQEEQIFTSKVLGASLRLARHNRNLNQIEVTEKTAIPLRKIRAFEHGEIIDFFDFVKYAEFLGADISLNCTFSKEDEELNEAPSLII